MCVFLCPEIDMFKRVCDRHIIYLKTKYFIPLSKKMSEMETNERRSREKKQQIGNISIRNEHQKMP